jgi:hypothetical protein
MPDPRGAKRLLAVGCKLIFAKSKIKVPIEVKDYSDFVPGTKYPKAVEKPVWFVQIEMPLHLMDDIKEGSIDLAGQKIDLSEIEDSYDKDLDKDGMNTEDEEDQSKGQLAAPTAGIA